MAQDVFQIRVISQAAGQIAENVFNYQALTGTPVTDPATTAESIIGQWQAHCESDFLAVLPNDATLIGYKCKRINNGGGPNAMVPMGSAGMGTGATIDTSTGPCLLFSYSNGVRYFSGRSFVPFLQEGAYLGNEIQAGYQTLVGAFLSDLAIHLAISAINYALVVWSRKHATSFTVQGQDISIKPGTQRRRLVPIM